MKVGIWVHFIYDSIRHSLFIYLPVINFSFQGENTHVFLINNGFLGYICAFGCQAQILSQVYHLKVDHPVQIWYGHVEPRTDFVVVVEYDGVG